MDERGVQQLLRNPCADELYPAAACSSFFIVIFFPSLASGFGDGEIDQDQGRCTASTLNPLASSPIF